jgi:excisionase family DNA binding protein
MSDNISDHKLLETRIALRPDEVARLLRCSVRTVYRLVEARALDAVPAGRKRGIRIPSAAVRDYLSSS